MTIARWLETDTNANKDISAAVSIGVYTADADRMVVADVSLDQVAGNGDYVIYVTRQINGAGSAYVLLPKTTCAAASGETAIAMQSGLISVRSGDVLTVMVDGLAGDTATPDTVVRWFEAAALRPTTADRTLDVSAGGEAGVDWANVGSPTTTVGLSGTTVKASTDTEADIAALNNLSSAQAQSAAAAALTAYDPPTNTEMEARTLAAADYTVVSDLPTVPSAANNADAVWDALLASHVGVGSAGAGLAAAGSAGDPWSTPLPGSYGTGTAGLIVGSTLGGATGAVVYAEGATLDDLLDELDTAHGAGSWEGVGAGVGTGSYTDTITDSGSQPLDGVRVQLSTDSAGTNLAYEAYTDALGVFTLRPDPGTYYRWLDLSGYTFTQGVEVTVT